MLTLKNEIDLKGCVCMQTDLEHIQVLPKSERGGVFDRREGGLAHTSYQVETAFYDCIKLGDVQLLESKMAEHLQNGFVIGRLSDDPLRQMQYWAVSSITLATRAAIHGGLDEIYAYNLSDLYIRRIDAMQNPEQIVALLCEKARELTKMVARVRGRLRYSPHVRRTVSYIENHLHEKLRVAALAENAGISADYLSAVFKRETGEALGHYILSRKLEEAKRLLENGCSCEQVAYVLAFCSESYFIACFKKTFGMTPRTFAANFPRSSE